MLRVESMAEGVADHLVAHHPRVPRLRHTDQALGTASSVINAGHVSHQGPSVLRWALFEAAQCAARRSSPDHAYYLEVAQRIDHNRACLSVARKLCRRAHHILRELGDDALAAPDLARAKLVDAAA
jgi:transposase